MLEGTMTRKTMISALLLLSLATLGACAKRQDSLPESVTTSLETVFTRGDVEACAALYAEDAEILPEDAPVVRGKKAIAEFFKDQVDRDISFDTDSTMSVVRGDL